MDGFALPLAFLGNIGTLELILIAVLILVLFGAHKIPELARSLGRAQREFQKARDEATKEIEVPPTTPVTEDERVRRAAADLGIVTDGKSTPELRAEIQKRLG